METLLDTEERGSLQSDILKVPHHGSRGSLSERFLEVVSPKMALFSAGEGNRYGHPRIAVLVAYKQFGAQIYRTDLDGAVTVTLKQGGRGATGFEVKSFRETQMQKVQWNRSLLQQEIENLRRSF